MRNIKKFANRAAYTAFRNSNEYVEPHLSIIEGEPKVVLNDYVYGNTPEPLTFNIKSGGVIKWLRGSYDTQSAFRVTLEYSKNGGTWTQITAQDVDRGLMTYYDEYGGDGIIPSGGISVNSGDVVQFRAVSNPEYQTISDNEYGIYHSFFGTTCEFDVSGNIMSLIDQDFEDLTTVPGAFTYLFSGCLVQNSRKLILPATTMNSYCYSCMFINCADLRTPPALPATTLVEGCYESMFKGCKKLKYVPTLPATTLASYCYQNMFHGCTSLTSVPSLPATTLASNCYDTMFSGCTGLTVAPELPATTLANYCYNHMFDGCTSLTTAPESLPATTMQKWSYQYMFYGCTSLTSAPTLSATTLADGCYQYMFQGCTSLTTAPTLPATTLVSNCYKYMFDSCSSLNYIKAMFTTTPSSSYTSNWVRGVAATGTFVKNTSAAWTTTGNDGIPTGWTVETASS